MLWVAVAGEEAVKLERLAEVHGPRDRERRDELGKHSIAALILPYRLCIKNCSITG